MWQWFEALSAEAKSLIGAVLGAVAGGIAGAAVKWLLDRAKISEMKELVDAARREREEANEDRRAAMAGRESVNCPGISGGCLV